MEFKIKYRGLDLTTTIDVDVTKVFFTKNGNKIELKLKYFGRSKPTKQFEIDYVVISSDADGNVFPSVPRKIILKGEIYKSFSKSIVDGELDTFIDRAVVNAILEDYFQEQVYPFNRAKNYSEMQPIIYDLVVSDNDLSVSLVDFDNAKTIKYKLDDGEFQNSNVFTGLDTGSHVVYVKTEEDNYIFHKNFNIAPPVIEGV
jgi:hypothetical protein